MGTRRTVGPEELRALESYAAQQAGAYEDLRNELTDHLACAVEARWAQDVGKTFEEVFPAALQTLGKNGMEGVLRDTHRVVFRGAFGKCRDSVLACLRFPYIATTLFLTGYLQHLMADELLDGPATAGLWLGLAAIHLAFRYPGLRFSKAGRPLRLLTAEIPRRLAGCLVLGSIPFFWLVYLSVGWQPDGYHVWIKMYFAFIVIVLYVMVFRLNRDAHRIQRRYNHAAAG